MDKKSDEIIVTPDGQPMRAVDAASTPTLADPALQQQIDQAKTELSGGKAVSADKTIGTGNALVFNLKIREVFRVVYLLLILAALAASVYYWHQHAIAVNPRLKLLSPAATAVALSLIRLTKQSRLALEGGAGLLVLLILWYKSRDWVIASLITRLVFLVFWTLAAWWLYNVLALGQVTPILPLVRGLN